MRTTYPTRRDSKAPRLLSRNTVKGQVREREEGAAKAWTTTTTSNQNQNQNLTEATESIAIRGYSK